MADASFLKFQIFKPYSELVCAFSTRKGGVSTGKFSSLNLGFGTGDSEKLVQQNRDLFYKKLKIHESYTVYPVQTHSTNIRIVKKPGTYGDTDGLICSTRGIFLIIQTADCFPVFIYAPQEGVVALLHVGWRGALLGIIERALSLIDGELKIDPTNVKVAIGPGLGPECFEVKEDVYRRFPDDFIIRHHEGIRKYLDLKGFIYNSLSRRNIPAVNIETCSICTMCNADLFYSYRRHAKHSGRMMGIIGVK
jgi:YfiH family protein